MKTKLLAAMLLATSAIDARAFTIFQNSPVNAWAVQRVTHVAGTNANLGVNYAPTPADFAMGTKTFLGYAPADDLRPGHFPSTVHLPGTGMLFTTHVHTATGVNLQANFGGDDGHYITVNHGPVLASGGFAVDASITLNLIPGWNDIEMGLYNGIGPSVIGLFIDDGNGNDIPLGDVPHIVVKAVPEPTSLLLMAAGIIGLGGHSRRKSVSGC